MTKEEEKMVREMMIDQAVAMVDEILAWQEEHPEAELIDMEEAMQKIRHKLTAVWLNIIVNKEAEETGGEAVKCHHCGRRMERKGAKRRQISSMVGELEYKREYYYCRACREGFFPPGSAVTNTERSLE
jgi:hypothetical protein